MGVVIKSQLDRMLGKWSMRHNEMLTIPALAERLPGITADFLYRLRAVDLSRTSDELDSDYAIQRLDLEKVQQLLDFFDCSLDDLLTQVAFRPPKPDD